MTTEALTGRLGARSRQPEVSLLLPVRDAAETLPDALDSVAAQTLADLELVIVDDGSTDGSADILRRFVEGRRRSRLLTPGRIGLVPALNLGLAECTAPFVARFDADDRMATRRLELQLEYLLHHPEIDVVSCLVQRFGSTPETDGEREYLRWMNGCRTPREILENIYVESPLAHPSVMFRRSVVEEAGGYREGDFPEDYELWLRLAARGAGFGKVEEVLLEWRDAPERTSRTDSRYARRSFDRLRARYLALDRRLRHREVVIWGAGMKTRRRTRLLADQGVEISCWIDIDPRKQGRELWNRPIHPPAWLLRSPRPFVLIYVTNHGAREEIESFLDQAGYEKGLDYLAVG